jgi:hypothetical protein
VQAGAEGGALLERYLDQLRPSLARRGPLRAQQKTPGDDQRLIAIEAPLAPVLGDLPRAEPDQARADKRPQLLLAGRARGLEDRELDRVAVLANVEPARKCREDRIEDLLQAGGLDPQGQLEQPTAS